MFDSSLAGVRQRLSLFHDLQGSSLRGVFGACIGGTESLVKGLDARKIAMHFELVCNVQGGADIDVFLVHVVSVYEKLADLVSVI